MFILSYPNFANAYRHFATMNATELFDSLGWAAKAGSPGYARNGALVTSLALLSLGIPLNGNLRIEAPGPLKGGKAFSGANHLARWLSEHRGKPEIFGQEIDLKEAAYQLFGQRGIVAFIQNSGPQGGDIRLLDGRNAQPLYCNARICHPREVHFWRLH